MSELDKVSQKKISRINKYLKDCKGWRNKREMIYTLGEDEKLFDFALKYMWIRERRSDNFLEPRYYKNFRNK
jgi:hypothetical protein